MIRRKIRGKKNYWAQYEAVCLSFKNLCWRKKKSNLCLIHIPKPKFTVVLGGGCDTFIVQKRQNLIPY